MNDSFCHCSTEILEDHTSRCEFSYMIMMICVLCISWFVLWLSRVCTRCKLHTRIFTGWLAKTQNLERTKHILLGCSQEEATLRNQLCHNIIKMPQISEIYMLTRQSWRYLTSMYSKRDVVMGEVQIADMIVWCLWTLL